MTRLFIIGSLIGLAVGLAPTNPPPAALVVQQSAFQSGGVTRFDLIVAMNTLRVSNGYPALIEDPIVNAVAQATAATMAGNQMGWHIGDVRGRIQAAGYGGGATVWATENFAVGTNMGIDQIMLAWADPDHMRPVTNPAYCHVGAGVATAANGRIYYVLQAAYTSGQACGEIISPEIPGDSDSGSGGDPEPDPIPQIIVPVYLATPNAAGQVIYVVQSGQSFWAIAVAYQITIADIEFWNNISREHGLQVGQELLIPTEDTIGFATPTPRGFVLPSLPDEDGRIIHSVAAYQTLSTIGAAYEVSVERLLLLNGLQLDWPLQIGQELIIDPGHITPGATPRPLTAFEKLTPAADGLYYHTVQDGETLSAIAARYEITLEALLSWNGLSSASIIQPGQALLLQITPPSTPTSTPAAPTIVVVVIARATPTVEPAPSATLPAAAVQIVGTSTETLLDVSRPGMLPAALGIGGLVLVLALGFLSLRGRELD